MFRVRSCLVSVYLARTSAKVYALQHHITVQAQHPQWGFPIHIFSCRSKSSGQAGDDAVPTCDNLIGPAQGWGNAGILPLIM